MAVQFEDLPDELLSMVFQHLADTALPFWPFVEENEIDYARKLQTTLLSLRLTSKKFLKLCAQFVFTRNPAMDPIIFRPSEEEEEEEERERAERAIDWQTHSSGSEERDIVAQGYSAEPVQCRLAMPGAYSFDIRRGLLSTSIGNAAKDTMTHLTAHLDRTSASAIAQIILDTRSLQHLHLSALEYGDYGQEVHSMQVGFFKQVVDGISLGRTSGNTTRSYCLPSFHFHTPYFLDREGKLHEFLASLHVRDLALESWQPISMDLQRFSLLKELRRLYLGSGQIEPLLRESSTEGMPTDGDRNSEEVTLAGSLQIEEIWLPGCSSGHYNHAEDLRYLPQNTQTLVLCCPGNDIIEWLADDLVRRGSPRRIPSWIEKPAWLPAGLKTLRFIEADVSRWHEAPTDDAGYIERASRLGDRIAKMGIMVEPSDWVERLVLFVDNCENEYPWREELPRDLQKRYDRPELFGRRHDYELSPEHRHMYGGWRRPERDDDGDDQATDSEGSPPPKMRFDGRQWYIA